MVTFHTVAYLFHRFQPSSEREKFTYIDMLPVILRNQCLILLPTFVTIHHFIPIGPVAEFCLLTFFLHVAGASICHDVVMYVFHRFILHSSCGFAYHKLHHTTFATVAASALYMSSIDFILEIVLPFATWFLIY